MPYKGTSHSFISGFNVSSGGNEVPPLVLYVEVDLCMKVSVKLSTTNGEFGATLFFITDINSIVKIRLDGSPKYELGAGYSEILLPIFCSK